jgi:hypothetical protein
LTLVPNQYIFIIGKQKETDVINPATADSDELNDFTNNVRTIARNFWSPNYWVKLRNGTLVRPIYTPAEDDTCVASFFADGYKYCWNLDGTSVTRPDYDMMEIVRND